MPRTKEVKGWFIEPTRLTNLRKIWTDIDVEGLLDGQIRNKLQLELSSHSPDTAIIRVGNPGPSSYRQKPYITAELGLQFAADDWDVDTKRWYTSYLVEPLYTLLLDENWMHAWYAGHKRVELERPERLTRSSLWSLVDKHIDEQRRRG